MRAKKEYVLRWGEDNERAFPTLDKAKAFADEHVPDPHGRWYQPHPGEWYREGVGDHIARFATYHISSARKLLRKLPLLDNYTCFERKRCSSEPSGIQKSIRPQIGQRLSETQEPEGAVIGN